MGQVFITRVIPGTAVETLREAGHEVEVWPEAGPPPPDVLAARLAAADAAMTMVVDRVPPSMRDTAPRLKVLANMAVAYDNIDPA